MKAVACCVIAFLICNAECGRKVLQPLNKNANLDFINMEGGGGVRPATGVKPVATGGAMPAAAPPKSAPPKSPPSPAATPPKSPPSPAVTPPKPAPVAASVTPAHKPAAPAAAQPVRPLGPAAAPAAPAPGASTPGPGSVKQLVNFYDSRGQASPIRPYSYSQAVKQGKH